MEQLPNYTLVPGEIALYKYQSTLFRNGWRINFVKIYALLDEFYFTMKTKTLYFYPFVYIWL